MKKRIISLVLVIVMLFSICMSSASCDSFEQMLDDYLNSDSTDNGEGDGNGDGSGEGNGDIPDYIANNKGDPSVPKIEGYNQITFFWKYDTGVIKYDLSKCDLWFWYGDVDGRGYMWKKTDETIGTDYGVMLTFNIPEHIEEVGFIVRTDCSMPGGDSWGEATKNSGDLDLYATIEGPETFIYLQPNKSNQYHSSDGGKTLNVIKKFTLAGMTTLNTIKYSVTPKSIFSSIDQFKVMDGDREIEITKVTNLGKSAETGVITVAEELDIGKSYTVSIEGFGDCQVVPTDIFDSAWFKENYNYDGDDLGATINGDGTTTFKVWAPTASAVSLNLFADGKKGVSTPTDRSFDMVRGEKGVWSFTAECGHGTFYTYTVTTGVGIQEAVDPYAKSAGVNGDRGMVVDLSQTNPDGWDEDASFSTGIESYSDAIVWEIHIRDFSNNIKNSEYKGKYLAFTESGLVNEHGVPVGIDYLKELGVNYVHILPSYDFATVNEDYLADDYKLKFNWGYDPKNYNVPEGSYSTNPYDGVTRITEYKQMVMALHEAGIGVVMDVVYNHTYDKNASFNKIVPYYYYRYTSSGANTNASGCGNDTASERYMYRKFMVDSVSYWISEYNLDGFRFDLMGLHDVETMQQVEAAIHGIDNHAIIYGEAWTMGSTTDGSPQANQGNMSKVQASNDAIGSIAVFNDVTRDALSGHFWAGKLNEAGYPFGNSGKDINKVIFGIKGGVGSGYGWQAKNSMVVNYVSCHDNHTLWDKLEVAGLSHDKKLAVNRLAATVNFISKGIVFFQAGEEMLRTKPLGNGDYDHNSYMSSDAINNIKWDTLKPGSDEYKMMQYYSGLAKIRNEIDIFTARKNIDFAISREANDTIIVTITDIVNDGKAVVVINPLGSTFSYDLGNKYQYHIICNGTVAGTDSLGTTTKANVPGCSAAIYVTENLLPNN